MPSPEPAVVVVQCYLCQDPADGLIVTIRSVAWWSAMDHALDVHLDHLLASPRQALNVFTVTTDDLPVRLRRSAGTAVRS